LFKLSTVSPRATRAKGRRTLVLLALFALSPIVASYAAYYWFAPTKRINYGELLEVRPAPAIAGLNADGTAFRLAQLRGRWLLVIVTAGDCGGGCLRALYATRQARTMQGREQERIVRVWLRPADASSPSPEMLAPHPGLVTARVDRGQLGRLPVNADSDGILLIDPHGNLVLRYDADPDIKRLSKDLERVLRGSQIG
jgi:hypothetical protein